MKILKQANSFVIKCLPMQNLEENRNYVLSKYVIQNGNLLYNSLTNESVLVEDFEKDERNLISRWYYVPTDVDVTSIAHIIRQRNLNANSGPGSAMKTSYVIFTTTACNAACEYCFEKDIKKLTMDDKTAEAVAEYICTTASKTDIKLKWFGGEPLVNKTVINIITDILRKKGITYHSELSTNGDLLPSCTDEELINWKLSAVQFTVDDVGTEYDRIKGILAGGYERLKNTLERLSKLIPKCRLIIRVHYDPQKGSEPCYRVIDDLGSYRNVQIYARMLYSNSSSPNYKELLKIEDYIVDTGRHRVFEFQFNYGPHCMSDSRKIACITPTGELTPCEHFAYGEHVYGSIYTGKKNEDILKKWSVREKYVTSSCKECPLYPSCRKLTMCPAEGKCSEGYQYYQIETIKRALRRRAENLNVSSRIRS